MNVTYYLSILLVLMVRFSFAQVSVSGVVTSQDDGQPLPGVSILIVGTQEGTTTDFDGKYSIEVKSGDVLVFSFVGMADQKVTIASSTTGKVVMDIVMQPSNEMLEDIVVVGYGKQSRENLATTTTTVKSETIESRGVVSLGEALTGLAPNLNIMPSAGGGEPGSGVNINIRGYASINSNGVPLILVDGMEQDINTLDPNDIASVTVLEDISSYAVYGARAAFGVILIETKRGSSGEPVVRYSTSVIASQFRNTPRKPSAYDFAVAMNLANKNGGATDIIFSDVKLKKLKDNPDKSIATKADDLNGDGRVEGDEDYFSHDALKAVFKDISFRMNYNLSVAGTLKYGDPDPLTGKKDKYIAYNLSGALFQQNGQYKVTEDGYDRKILGVKINSRPVKWLQMGIDTRFTRRNIRGPVYAQYGAGWGAGLGIIYHNLLRSWPTQRLKNENGYIDNTYGYLSQAKTFEIVRDNIALQAKFELEPIENWKTFLNYRMRTRQSNEEKYLALVNKTEIGGTEVPLNPSVAGRYTKYATESLYVSPQIYTQYELRLSEIYLKTMLGFEQESYNSSSFWGRRYKVASDQVPSISTGVGDTEVE